MPEFKIDRTLKIGWGGICAVIALLWQAAGWYFGQETDKVQMQADLEARFATVQQDKGTIDFRLNQLERWHDQDRARILTLEQQVANAQP